MKKTEDIAIPELRDIRINTVNPIRTLTLVIGFFLATLFAGGCSLPKFGGANEPAPYAFIYYETPPPESTGIRLAIKDLIDVKGVVTTAGSQYLKNHAKPAERDAKCLEIVRERGAIILGKTNLSEFAIGVSGANDYFGTPENPISNKRNRIPGGSSSGSATAVAQGFADVSFGTDTAGSIRVPAACCGITGLKTTYGLVSLEGVYPVSPDHLDTVGPIARDITGLVQGMGLLQRGFESLYEQAQTLHPTPQKIRIGRLYIPGTQKSIDKSIDDALEEKGFQVVRMDDAFVDAWLKAQEYGNIVAASGAWKSNKHLFHNLTVSARTKAVMLLGQTHYLTSYKRALKHIPQWKATLRNALENVDAIATPVLKKTPLKMVFTDQPAVFEARVLALQNTAAVNLAGNPAIAVPILLDRGTFPVTSIQFVGPPRSEAFLMNIGRLMEDPIAESEEIVSTEGFSPQPPVSETGVSSP